MNKEQLRQMKYSAELMLRIADNEDWSENDQSRILANMALLAIGYIAELESKLETAEKENAADSDNRP